MIFGQAKRKLRRAKIRWKEFWPLQSNEGEKSELCTYLETRYMDNREIAIGKFHSVAGEISKKNCSQMKFWLIDSKN